MRILIVEDEPDLLRGLAKTLREEGYAVDCAEDGREGLQKAQDSSYDAMVLDVMVPVLDGFALLSELRRTKDTPVLMLTARAELPNRLRGLDCGADDYLAKPFDLDELCARLRALIRRAAGHASPALTIDDVGIDFAARPARRMQKLAQSLLQLAPHDAGALVLQAEPCDLAGIARETAALLQPAAAERGLTFTLDLAPAPCRADPDRLAQVLLNLLTNALDHTPAAGRITIQTHTDAGHATAAVTDPGPGVAAEHLPRLFDRFYRADDSRNRRTGGAGLGLAICKAIADAHGGTLEVVSEVEKGSTFTLRLPLDTHGAGVPPPPDR